MIPLRCALVSAICFITACAESDPVTPAALTLRSAMARGSKDACIAPANEVVTTDAELRAALAGAQEDEVIAISGTIAITLQMRLAVPRITLTCVVAGDGVMAATPPPVRLLDVVGPNITVQGLAIDGSRVSQQPVIVNSSSLTNGDGARLLSNRVQCASGGCVFIVGARNVVVADNHFESSSANTGVHLQRNTLTSGVVLLTDNAEIERNVFEALNPQGNPLFGAIRARDGRDMIIRNNEILGPWANGLAMTDVRNAVIEHNSVSGVSQHGLLLGANATDIGVDGLLVRANVFAATQGPALSVDHACNNAFVGNRFDVAAGDINAFFAEQTGNNRMLGPTKASVDDGARDCDGDGTIDPNFLSGHHARNKTNSQALAPVEEQISDSALR